MTTDPKSNPLPRVISLLLVTLVVAWLMHLFNSHSLSRMESMTPADHFQYQRRVLAHSYLFSFVIALVFGGFYIGAVDAVTWLIRALMPKAAKPNQ